MGRSTTWRLTSLLGFSVVAGVVVAALMLPAAALTGFASKAMWMSFDALPSDLQIPPVAQRTSVYANDGTTLITTFYDENRRNVPLDKIAPVMRQAIVAAEDTRFFSHSGVDLRGVLRALIANVSGGSTSQGASTLTMQYVRNVLKSDPNLTPAERAQATADTPGRKLREMRYALALEQKLSKQEILQRYLNVAYFGDGAYGIEAASDTYFSKPAADLTLPEAALLAGLVQSPDADNPVNGDENRALQRRSYVLEAMANTGAIPREAADAARATPLGLHPSPPPPNGCTQVPSAHDDWGFFCDYLQQWWDGQPAFGANTAERDQELRRGGYTIVTSLDPGIQAEALRQSLGVYPYSSPRALPMAVVQPGTGRVLAMAVNRHYSLDSNPGGHTTYPNTVNQLIAGGAGATGYQAGSTFKMFTMLAALEAGKPLDTGFNAPSPLVTKYPASGPGSCGGRYCPVNDNPAWMNGYRTMWTGFGRSVNTYFVWLEQQIGPERAVDMAKRLGIVFRAGGDARMAQQSAQSWASFTLGVSDTTPLDLAEAYATVAADGKYCSPLPVLSITDSAGKQQPAGPECRQAVRPDVARAAADAARCPIGQQSSKGHCDGGTATMVSGILGGRPAGGKTGSAEHNATESFVGFTPQIAAAGIAADPDNPGDYVGGGVASAVDAAVARTMAAALQGQPATDFPQPSNELAYGPDGVDGSAAPPPSRQSWTPTPPGRQSWTPIPPGRVTPGGRLTAPWQ